jgi:hypothetical protein
MKNPLFAEAGFIFIQRFIVKFKLYVLFYAFKIIVLSKSVLSSCFEDL